MPTVTLTYKLDVGSCGMRDVKVNASVLTDITGKLYLELVSVIADVHGHQADLLPFVGMRYQEAMCEALKHQYWSEMAAKVRDAQEAGA